MGKMKTQLTALAFALVASAAFAQTSVPTVQAKKEKPAMLESDAARSSAKTLRGEIERDQGELAAKTKSERAQRKELAAQEKAEIAKVRAGTGTRADKKKVRQAIRERYARLVQDIRHKSDFERKRLREDITSKRDQIRKLRQS